MHIWILVHPFNSCCLWGKDDVQQLGQHSSFLPLLGDWACGEGRVRGGGWGWSNTVSFSCCLCCPAEKLKPCFSVSATEQQQNQYSKHCKRNTPSADVHGIFPNCYFFPVWFNFDSVLSPSPLPPNPKCCLCCSVSACVLASFCVPVLLWSLIIASQALGWGCWAELWLDVGIAACLDFPVCHPCIVLCVRSTVPAGFGEAGLEEQSGKTHPLS